MNVWETNQCEGPDKPTAEELILRLKKLPKHLVITQISINGQTGRIMIGTRHEDLDQLYVGDSCINKKGNI